MLERPLSVLGPAGLALCLLALSGCFGGGKGACSGSEEYKESGEAALLKMPADLQPMDSQDRLVIPPVATAQNDAKDSPCLEAPPDYFGRSVK